MCIPILYEYVMLIDFWMFRVDGTKSWEQHESDAHHRHLWPWLSGDAPPMWASDVLFNVKGYRITVALWY